MSAPFTYPPLERLTIHNHQMSFQSPSSAIMTSQEQWEHNRDKNGLKAIGIGNERMPPISHDEAARIRQEATKTLSKIPAMLHVLSVGSTWYKSAEDRMREYQLLDSAAQAVELLKSLNIRDGEVLRQEAKSKAMEDQLGTRKSLKYWVNPEEMEKTREEMRGVRERRSKTTCLKDCMRTLMYDFDPRWSFKPDYLCVLERVQEIMNSVEAATLKLQTDSRDGHWALGLLQYYCDAWVVFLDELNTEFLESWYDNFPMEKAEDAKQRAKVAEKIIGEIGKERGTVRWF